MTAQEDIKQTVYQYAYGYFGGSYTLHFFEEGLNSLAQKKLDQMKLERDNHVDRKMKW
jgi:hypothetical protein